MPPRNESRQSRRPRVGRPALVALFGVALTLRVAHVLTLRHSPFFDGLLLDLRLYDEWASSIASGRIVGEGPFFQDPFYAYVLGAFYAVWGHARLPALLLQAALGAAVAPLLLLAARRHFGAPAAWSAGIIAALYLPAVYYDGLILKTSGTLLLVALLLWLTSRAGEVGIGAWLLTGAVLGAACLNRGNLLMAVPLLAGWIVARAPTPPRDRSGAPGGRVRLRELIALLAGLLLLLGPAALHNRLAGGEWILTTANAGQNLYIGNNPLNLDGEYQALPFVDSNPRYEQRDFAREAQLRTGVSLGPRAVSRFWRDEALHWIGGHPGDFVRLGWRKLRLLWGAYEVPDNLDYYLYREYAPLLRLPVPGFGFVAPLGLLGALLALRRAGWPRLVAAFVGCYTASVALFFVLARFRMAMMPALYVLAGFALAEAVTALRKARGDRTRRWRIVAFGALLLSLFLFVNLPVRGPAEGRTYRLAGALGLPRRAETTALAHYNLGLVHAARAEQSGDETLWYGRAEAELLRAIELEPDRVKFHVELGKVLAQQQRNVAAIERYRAAERLDPANHRLAHSIGLLQRRLGDAAAAERSFRRALELAPRQAAGAVQLGELLFEMGRVEEAAQLFRYALRLRPADRRAREGLDRALGEP